MMCCIYDVKHNTCIFFVCVLIIKSFMKFLFKCIIYVPKKKLYTG